MLSIDDQRLTGSANGVRIPYLTSGRGATTRPNLAEQAKHQIGYEVEHHDEQLVEAHTRVVDCIEDQPRDLDLSSWTCDSQ